VASPHDGASDTPADAFAAAHRDVELAYEAVGDAEDVLRDAEIARDHPLFIATDAERAEAERRVQEAEAAWHARRHEAHAAARARDVARAELGAPVERPGQPPGSGTSD
jgi:hypothetical protein